MKNYLIWIVFFKPSNKSKTVQLFLNIKAILENTELLIILVFDIWE